MKLKEIILVIILTCLSICSYSQVTDITWQRCFQTVDDYSNTYCISEFKDGYLVGIQVSTESEGISNYHDGSDAWFVYFDTLGNVLWERCYGGSQGDRPLKIVPIDDNHYYLIMYTSSHDGDVQCNFNEDEGCVWVVKIDTSGNILWQQCYGGDGSGISPRDAILTPDGGLLLLAGIFGQDSIISTYYGSNDMWLWKIDTTGAIQWETTIGTSGTDSGFKLMYTSQNTYLALCGLNASDGMSTCELNGTEYWDLDVWLIEYDLYGNILSQDCYGGTGWDNAVNFTETDDGYAIITASESYDGDVSGYHGTYDMWVLILDKDKNIQWERCYGGHRFDHPQYITQTNDKGYIFIGATRSGEIESDVIGNHHVGYNDIWMVKTNNVGEIEWQRCFGGFNDNSFKGYNVVLKKNDYNFVFAAMGSANDGDQSCDGDGKRGWIFEIKDCQHYAPAQPQQPTGKDTLCVNTDSITTYTTPPATNAWYYEWELQPGEAGTTLNDSITTTVNWNPNYEGPATLKVRSTNDCGESAWSDSLVIQTYMCLGTEENSIASNLRVYPNPATNTLIVELDSGVQKPSLLEIFNSTGARVYSSKTTNKSIVINVSDWNSGIYIVKVITESDNYSRKVVVR